MDCFSEWRITTNTMKEEKIAVVMDGMDVCRIVPYKPIDGNYEIKIDFLTNEFEVACYKLFSHEPMLFSEAVQHEKPGLKSLGIHSTGYEEMIALMKGIYSLKE